jgi:hypothetical protein
MEANSNPHLRPLIPVSLFRGGQPMPKVLPHLVFLTGLFLIGNRAEETLGQGETARRISGAAKFVRVDPEAMFRQLGPNVSDCGVDIVDASGGEDPLPLFPTQNLAAGTELHIPSILSSPGFETRIAVQNVGDDYGVTKIFYFDDEENFFGSDCAFIGPGASHIFGPDSVPDDAAVATILSYRESTTQGSDDIYDICVEVVSPMDKTSLPEKGGGGPSEVGPYLTAQVQRIRTDQPEGEPLVSTMYNAPSNRMGDSEREGDRDRYILHRVVTSADADTHIYLYNTYAAPTIADVTFFNQVNGASLTTQIYLTGYDQHSLSAKNVFSVSDVFQDGFEGWALVENFPGAEAPLAIVADLVYGDGQAIASYTPGYLPSFGGFNGESSEYAIAPVVYRPGWETVVALVNDENSPNVALVERFDALGNPIDSQNALLFNEEAFQFEFPDPGLGPDPVAGYLRVTGEPRVSGMVQLLRKDQSGNVLETIAYNLHLENETVSPDTFETNKGNLPQEIGGADLLALPMAGKWNSAIGLETEILLTNLNPLPGLTSASIYLYDGAGLRDLQCVILGPNETVRIPVDFPRLGDGALASLVIRGTTTSQKVEINDDIFNTYALAAVAYQRTKVPAPPPDSEVYLAPGGNDAGMAYTGANENIGSRFLMVPSLRTAAGTPDASASLHILGFEDDFSEPTRALVVFFNEENVAGAILTETLEHLVPVEIDDVAIPPDARSAAILTVDAASAPIDPASISGDLTDFARLISTYYPPPRFLLGPKDIDEKSTFASPINLQATVLRDATSPDGSGNRVFSAYEATQLYVLGLGRDNRYTGTAYEAPLVLTEDGFDTAISIQSVGPFPIPVEVMFLEGTEPQSFPKVKTPTELSAVDKALGTKSLADRNAKTILIENLAPGLATVIRPADYVGEGFNGTVLVRGFTPLAVVIDVYSGGSLSSHTARPALIAVSSAVQDGDDDDDDDDSFGGGLGEHLPDSFSFATDKVYGPLVYSPNEGWETNVYVQNIDHLLDAKVRVDFFDQSGQIVETRTGFIPPGSAVAFSRPATVFSPDSDPTTTGWVRVVSEEYWDYGMPAVGATRILGVVQLLKRNSAGCVLENLAYNLLAEEEVKSQYLGFFKIFTPPDTFLTFPSVVRQTGPFEISTDLALANVNIYPETTQVNLVEVRGPGFSNTFSPFTFDERETRLFKTPNIVGFPSDVGVSYTLDLTPPLDGLPTEAIAIAGVAVQRAYGLLPNDECVALDTPTPTQTATASTDASLTPTSTPSSSATADPSSSPTPTPSITPTLDPSITPSETPVGGVDTPTPTPTFEGGIDPELLMADINKDGRVDHLDQLILLKWWFESYEIPGRKRE